MKRFAAILIAALLAAFVAVSGGQAQSAPVTPPAPLVLARGESVSIAWRLPNDPRPINVVLYRRVAGGTLARIGEFPAEQLSFVDKDVQQGKNYEYAIAAAYRKGPVSPISPIAAVSIAGGARITLKGGSLARAVFEVTIFDQGRKITSEFVNLPGETIGDLGFVKDLNKTLDFRLGAKLLALEVAEVSGVRPQREALMDTAGKPMTDATGKPINLEFKLPGDTREVIVARIRTKDGRTVALHEGESIDG
ncbi:MAG: fibronectin type III domain-containing protein [Planctomycetes bacterium]|nr:fibronectin type III domain-containing protein [Planctomycetota bacterium]